METPSYLINGSFTAALDPRDRGLAYGHGLFETLRISAGSLPLWIYHWKRLTRSARVLGIDLPQDLVEKELAQALQVAPSEGVLKLIVTAGCGQRGYRASRPSPCNRILQWFPLSVEPPESIRLQRCNYRLPANKILAGLKHLNRLDQVMAAEEVRDGCQGLLLDTAGNLVEALSHNLFMRVDDCWWTPLLDTAGVAGVLRSVLIEEVFPSLDVEVEQAVLPLDELYSADEVFVCNSIQGVVPVTEEIVAGKDWPSGTHTQQIKQKLKELYPCFTA
jgi:4-amino-4-deoxychorismate lyase